MTRTTAGTMTRSLARGLLVVLSGAFLVFVIIWLAGKPTVRFTLGRGEALVAEPGINSFLVREADGLWRLYDGLARQTGDGHLLPTPALGRPALQADGSAYVLTDQGLMWVHSSQALVPGGEIVAVRRAVDLPEGVRLEGVVGARDALLSAPVHELVPGAAGPDLRERRLLLCESGAGDARLVPVADAAGEARVPAGREVLLGRAARELAFLGEQGWEAWSLGADGGPARRAVAQDCTKPGALFVPQGGELLVRGRVDGLWLLSLSDGRMKLVGEGDLGVSRRVPMSYGWRFDPVRLVASHWDPNGWLQVFQTHVPSGTRWGFNLGFVHHYGVAMSADGRFMAYVQAVFDEDAEDPFVEHLYRFDFNQPELGAVEFGARRGGHAGQGPVFIGSGGSLVFIANGEVMRSEGPPDSSDR